MPFERFKSDGAFASVTGEIEQYNENAEFNIGISNVNDEIRTLANELCKEVIKRGHEDGYEHGFTIDIVNGEYKHYSSEQEGEVFGPEFL